MNEADTLEVAREGILVLLQVAGPLMLISLAVGLVISMIQAVTQLQEVTLTFVPKIVVMLVVMTLMGPFIGEQVYAFTEQIYSRIEKGY